MRQFFKGSCTAFLGLELAARHSCARFLNREMPPGAVPARAAIGFEIDQATGVARLLVERGVIYSGPSSEVREWFQNGERTFDNFIALISWLSTTLMAAFEPTSQTEPDRLATSAPDSEGRPGLALDNPDTKALNTTAPQRPGEEELLS